MSTIFLSSVVVSERYALPAGEKNPTSQNAMLIDAEAYRKDVERTVEAFVRDDVGRIGSMMGRLAIHDSRVELRTLRPELYRPPTRPRVMPTPDGVGDHGSLSRLAPLRHVVPSGLVAQVVNVKASHGSLATDKPHQTWRLDIVRVFSRMDRACPLSPCRNHPGRCEHSRSLLEAATINVMKWRHEDERDRCDGQLRSQRWRTSHSKDEIAKAETARAVANREFAALATARKKIVHTSLYDEAPVLFARACGKDLHYILRLEP